MLTQVKRQNQDENPGMSDSEHRLLPRVHYCFVKLVNSQASAMSRHASHGVGDGGNHFPACLSAISVLTLQFTFMLPLE